MPPKKKKKGKRCLDELTEEEKLESLSIFKKENTKQQDESWRDVG